MSNIDDKIIEDFKLIEQRVTEMYYELIGASEISNFKLNVFEQKFQNIQLELTNLMNISNKNSTKNLLKNFGLLILCIGLLILSMVLVLKLSPLVYLSGGICLVIGNYSIRKINKDIESGNKITKQVNHFKNILENCTMLLTKFKNKNIKELTLVDDEDLFEIMLSNSLIVQYMKTPFSDEMIPDNAKNWIVRMLQTEFNTKEENVLTLLDMAREKYLDEMKENTICHSLKLNKKDKTQI